MRLVIAEKDKETLENKLSASSEALESLNRQMDGLSLKLDSTQETIKSRKLFLLALNFIQKVDLKSLLVWFVFEVLNSNKKNIFYPML